MFLYLNLISDQIYHNKANKATKAETKNFMMLAEVDAVEAPSSSVSGSTSPSQVFVAEFQVSSEPQPQAVAALPASKQAVQTQLEAQLEQPSLHA